jgi:hypothetical protein
MTQEPTDRSGGARPSAPKRLPGCLERPPVGRWYGRASGLAARPALCSCGQRPVVQALGWQADRTSSSWFGCGRPIGADRRDD